MTDDYPVQQCDEPLPHDPHVQAFYRQDGPGTFSRDDLRRCPGVAHPDTAKLAELERWQNVDLENYKRHLAELTEMLTAATDVAMQRGKRIDYLEDERDVHWRKFHGR
jgi:hypothetical protein